MSRDKFGYGVSYAVSGLAGFMARVLVNLAPLAIAVLAIIGLVVLVWLVGLVVLQRPSPPAAAPPAAAPAATTQCVGAVAQAATSFRPKIIQCSFKHVSGNNVSRSDIPGYQINFTINDLRDSKMCDKFGFKWFYIKSECRDVIIAPCQWFGFSHREVIGSAYKDTTGYYTNNVVWFSGDNIQSTAVRIENFKVEKGMITSLGSLDVQCR